MENALVNITKDQLDKFDQWLTINLDRSFPDHIILSVFQFHFINAFVDTGVSFDDMVKTMKDQYEVIVKSKQEKIAVKPNVKKSSKKSFRKTEK
jgi:hypothetical protein